MEETAPQNVPPPDDIMTPQDSLEQSTTSVAPTTSLEGAGAEPGRDPARISDGGAEIVDDVPEQKHFGSFLQNKLLRKVGLASGVLLGIITLLVVGTLIFQKTHKSSLSQAEKIGQIKDQSVKLQDTTASTGPNSLRTGVATLFVNGDVSVQGLLRFNNGANYGQVDSSSLTSNQTYKLPNASGTICLDSGNCQFASAADLAAVQSTASAAGAAAGALEAAANATKYTGGSGVTITGSVITNSGVLSVNGSVGDINLQGTANQVIITNANGVSTFALPQDIGLSSAPTFGGLVLSSIGTQNGFNLCDQSNNCGYGVNSIVQGGNAFGTDVQVGASDNSGLQLLTNNTNRFSITNNGAITIGGANSDRITALAQFSGSTPLVFQGGTDDFFTTSLVITNPTSNRNIILPNADGTVCLSSGNCSGAGGYGDVLNGGNNFNSTMTLGTNDNFGFNLKTNNVNRITISNTGTTALLGNVTSAADVVLGTNSTNRLTINSEISGATPFIFQGATNDGFATTFSITDPTANHNITFPNADGTVCLSSGNCTGPVGTGDVLQGGNNFGGTMILGTNDNFGFDFKTNNTTRLTISNTGEAVFNGDLTVAGNNVFGASSANRITFNGQVLGGAPLVFQGATDNAFATFLLVADPTATRTITIPNADGTICLSSGNCSTSGGTGDVNNGGNNFNSTMVLGTNDNFGLNLKTNNTVRLSITNGGQVTVQGNFLVNGDTLLGATSAQSVTFQAQNIFAPNDLNIDTYTQYIDTTNNQVGFGTLPLGTARVGILATNAGDALTVNNGQSAGNILNLQDNGVNVVTVANEGYTTFRNTTNNASAFQIQNAAGATIVNTDTTNRTLNVNGGPSTYSFTPTGPILANPISYTVGSRPYGVAFGNFNGDAYPDMVSANSSSDNASVLINNGNGTFANKVDYATVAGNSTPQYVAVGDFNADGRDDFVVTNYYGTAVSVFINNGNGTFAARVNYTIQSRSYGVTVADLNADGKPDIIATATALGGEYVSVLMNNGNGTFANKVDYTTCASGYQSMRVAAADFNSDGSQDLAVSCNTTNNDQIAIMTNNGNGTFAAAVRYTTASTGGGTYDIKTGDFNSDGKPDIVTGDYYGSRVSVYLNNGVGLFGGQVNYTVGLITMSVAVADFNGDGIQDIAASNTNSSSISLLLGNGNGTFQGKVDYTTNLYNVGVLAAADVNLDGKQDLAEAYSVGASVGIMLGSGSTTTVKNSLSVATPSSNETALFIKQAFGQIADLIRVADSNGSSPILSLSGTGALYLKNTTNSTSALQVQNTAGTNVLEVDTTNSRVGINLGSFVTPTNTLTVNGLTTADSTAQVAIGTGAVGNKGLVIQGIASQTANLFEAQVSTGTVVASIGATGATLFKNSADSTAAFAIQNAAGTNLLNADTTILKVSLANVTSVLSAWSTSAQSLLGTRYNSTAGAYNGYVYLVGDEGSLIPSYAKLNADGMTGAWTASANSLPERRASASGVIANGYYYLLGGQNATTRVNTVLYSKLNADGTMGAWQSAANTLPVAISGGATVTANGYLYHIGGTTGSASNAVYYARINADGSVGTWTTSANSLPALRASGSATVSGGYVYYVGGSNSNTVYYAALNADGSTGAWQTNANALPAVRNASQALVAFAGSLYLSGGMDASAGTNTTYYATLNGNGSTNAWATSAFSLPTARAQNSNVVANGYLYVIGSSGGSSTTVYYTKLPGAQTGLTVTQTATTLYNSLTVQNADASTFINADIPTNTLTVNGATTLRSINSGAVGLIVQGAVGQTADLMQAQDSSGTSLFAVTSAGNISLGKEAAHSLSIADSTTTNIAGGALTVQSGSGNGTGGGGNLNLLAGQSGLTNGATAGTVNITAGSSGAGFGNAGNVNITAGNGFSTPGNITIQAGNNGFASFGTTSINANGGKTTIGASSSGFYLDSSVNLTVSGGNVSVKALAVPVISTVSTGSSYYYVVTAYNAQGETLASNSVGMADNTSTITWSVVPGATGYKLYRNTINSFSSGSLLRTTITVPGTASFLDTGAATGAGLPPTTTTGTKTVVQAWSGQTGDILQLQTSAAVNVLTVSSTGAVLSKNSVDSATAFQIQNAAGTNLFTADTTNNQIKIGGAASATPTLLILSDGNSTDPTGTNGAIYYNSALGKFRCYQGGSWTNCIGTGGGGGGDIAQGGNTFGVPVVIGASDAFALNLITSNTTRLSISATGAVAIGATGTAGTVEKFRVGTPTVVDNAAASIISTGATGSKGLVVQGVASQAGNLQEWQDSTGTALLAVQSNGRLNFGSSTQAVVLASSTLYFRSSGSTIKIQDSQAGNVEIASGGGKVGINTTGGSVVGQLHVTPLSAATIGTVIQGAASQSANLQEWQNSAGTVLASLSSSGSFNAAAVRTSSGPQLTVTNDTAAYGGGVSAVGGISVYHWNSSINLTPGEFGGVGFVNTLTTSASGAITTTLTTAKAASVVVAVKGAASQSANLQEWQSSAGTVLAYVSSAGRIKASSGGSAGLLVGTTSGIRTDVDAGSLTIYNSTAGQYIGIIPSANGILYLGTATDTAAIEARRQVNISSTADAIKLQIQGAATQTADLQQWQTNGGAVLASIGGSGAAFFKNSADSTTAFRIQNAAGTNLFTADTTNNQIKIGGAASATPTLFVFADGNSGTDPTGTNGAMYYNSSLGKFRCYQAGAWANCLGSGGGGGGDVNNGGNNYGSTMVLGTLDAQQLNLITSNSVRMSITAGGNVGINNTSAGNLLSVNTPTTADSLAQTLIATGATTNKGLVIQGVASQTADLFQAQDSAGTVVTKIDSSGNIAVQHTGNASLTLYSTNSTGAQLNFGNAGANAQLNVDPVGGGIRYFLSGSEKARLNTTGTFQINSATNTVGTVEKFRVNTPTTVDNLANAILSTSAATSKGLVIQGSASQSANLQEWQSSAGTVLAAISSTGSLFTLDSKRALESVAAGLRVGEGYTTVQTVKPLSVNGGSNPTLGTVENLRVGIPTTVDNTSNVTIGTSATTAKGLVIQGVASQTASLFQVQNSAGTAIVDISAAGDYSGPSATLTTSVGIGASNRSSTGALRLQNNGLIGWRNAANSADFTLGLNASNILETSSGTIVQFTSGAIQFNNTSAAGGQIRLPNAGSGIRVRNAANTADIMALTVSSSDVLQLAAPVTTNDATTTVSIGTTATTNKGLIIQGVASQSADLFQVQSSTGAVLAKIAATGNITVGSAGGTIISGNGNSVFTGGVAVATGAQYIGWGGGKLLMYSPAAGMLGFDGSTNAFPALKRVNTELQVRLADDSGFGQFSAGATRINSTGSLGTVEQFRVNTPTTVDNTAVSVLATGATTSKGLVIQGVASQTANLLEVQSSAGVVLASVDASGNMTLNGSLNIATGSLKVAGVDRIDNTGSLVNVSYNGSTIAVAKGGTGATSFTANGILFGNGSGAIQSTAAGNSGQCLNAVTGSAPVWASCTPAASGNVNQGGNNFGSDVTLGATDNFGINLLANNVAVAKFSASGQATFQNGTDSVTALQVQNAAGTSLFTIDSTNSRVYVGNPTADSTGTLLVLDTKNTSGDPTGVNGAMYYNSNLGKFRCYEGGSWKDCIYSQQTATKASDQTMSSTSYADVSSLSFSVLANTTYKLSCNLLISVPSGTNGGNLSTNGPASPSQYTATFAKALDQSSGDNYATSSTFDDGSAATTFKVNTVSTGSNRFIVSYNSILVNGGNSGTWSLRGKAFDGSSSITFYANSSCDLKPL